MINDDIIRRIMTTTHVMLPNKIVHEIIETEAYYWVFTDDEGLMLSKDTLEDYTKSDEYDSWSQFSKRITKVIFDEGERIINTITY